MHRYGLAPELYASFTNGLVYEFVPGVTLNPVSVYEPKIWRLVAEHMAKMHKMPLTSEDASKDPMLKIKMKRFLELVPEKLSDPVKQEM